MLSALTAGGFATITTITLTTGEAGVLVSLEGRLVGRQIVTAVDALMKVEAELLAMIE